MFIRKILVAGLAVVGIVGIASAQTPTMPITTNALGAGAPTGLMEVSYTVQLLADMKVNPKTLVNNDLFNDPSLVTNYGNLGTVVVTTNYPRWDVEVVAQNSLKLTSGGTPPTITCNEFNECTPSGGTTGQPLKGVGTTDALLKVYVGLRTQDLSTGWVSSGLVDLSTGLQTGNTTSFASNIGTALNTGAYNGQDGGPAATAGTIAAAGFNTPDPSNAGTPDGAVTFYVSAGFDPTTVGSGKITGNNEEGIYSEYLTFTMIAGF